MGGTTGKKVVSLPIAPDAQHEIDQLWAFELSMREVPRELDSYFEALRIASMNYSQKRHRAANKWASIAYERLVEAIESDPAIPAYLEPFDPDDIEDGVELLPRVRKRRSKSEIVREVCGTDRQ